MPLPVCSVYIVDQIKVDAHLNHVSIKLRVFVDYEKLAYMVKHGTNFIPVECCKQILKYFSSPRSIAFKPYTLNCLYTNYYGEMLNRIIDKLLIIL